MLLTKLNIPVKFCSIDASSIGFGYAYYDGGALMDYGKITFSGSTINDKIKDIGTKTYNFFTANPATHIAIEQTVFVNNPKTLADLSRCQGALLVGGFLAGVQEARTVPPITWQNAIGNKALSTIEKQRIRDEFPGKSTTWYKGQERKVRKQKTIDYVNKRYGLKLDDDDVCDAIAIGGYALDNWNRMTA